MAEKDQNIKKLKEEVEKLIDEQEDEIILAEMQFEIFQIKAETEARRLKKLLIMRNEDFSILKTKYEDLQKQFYDLSPYPVNGYGGILIGDETPKQEKLMDQLLDKLKVLNDGDYYDIFHLLETIDKIIVTFSLYFKDPILITKKMEDNKQIIQKLEDEVDYLTKNLESLNPSQLVTSLENKDDYLLVTVEFQKRKNILFSELKKKNEEIKMLQESFNVYQKDSIEKVMEKFLELQHQNLTVFSVDDTNSISTELNNDRNVAKNDKSEGVESLMLENFNNSLKIALNSVKREISKQNVTIKTDEDMIKDMKKTIDSNENMIKMLADELSWKTKDCQVKVSALENQIFDKNDEIVKLKSHVSTESGNSPKLERNVRELTLKISSETSSQGTSRTYPHLEQEILTFHSEKISDPSEEANQEVREFPLEQTLEKLKLEQTESLVAILEQPGGLKTMRNDPQWLQVVDHFCDYVRKIEKLEENVKEEQMNTEMIMKERTREITELYYQKRVLEKKISEQFKEIQQVKSEISRVYEANIQEIQKSFDIKLKLKDQIIGELEAVDEMSSNHTELSDGWSDLDIVQNTEELQ
ncbi:PACT_coil_coil domain-containing protein [Caenorhabditis elegans]|uniref:PACT_coil_coil domain-containing protein n=1 Tax=Caenorhabditis elegans TaxID=6239 RepID=Q19636_CAEEL|nr:PACT_coil_coil domain-containing protein [Caenorhabditis elegans]CAA92298.3 PACT_coil_coil domain-containing protein [Caenorhabditis elegans]|eukprot:NP_501512.3 Uncharacterized protein CELE_F20C5.5 [Caenorhabditis elegans]